MKINEVLNHTFWNLDEDSFLEVQKILNDNCRIFCRAINDSGNFLYHGSGREDSENGSSMKFSYDVLETRPRKPVVTKLANIIDKQLIKLGFKALRSNSIFCSTSMKIVQQFGPLYLLFPFNNAAFTWSTSDKVFYYGIDNYFFGTHSAEEAEALSPEIFKETFGIRNKNWSKALMTNHEIMVNGKFLAVRYNQYNVGLIVKYLQTI